MAVWLYGWVAGCMAVWLCGCVAVWLCGCMAVWLYGPLSLVRTFESQADAVIAPRDTPLTVRRTRRRVSSSVKPMPSSRRAIRT